MTIEILESRIAPAVLTVNSTNDNITDTSDLTLREAIVLVNNAGNPSALGQTSMPAAWAAQINTTQPFGTNDTIVLADTTYSLSGADNNWYGPNALPAISSTVTINGNDVDELSGPAVAQVIFNAPLPAPGPHV